MRAVPTLSITNAGTGGNISDGNTTQTIASLNAADRNVDGASMYLNLNGDLGDIDQLVQVLMTLQLIQQPINSQQNFNHGISK